MMRVAVIGAGAMGQGIGQVAATAGHEVLVYDVDKHAIQRARDGIQLSLNKLAEKGKITDTESKSIFGRLYFIDHFESVQGSGVVIEAIRENESEKKEIFKQIESSVDSTCILATNTSSLSVTGLAAALKNPERFIGIHFFNPPVLMKLVEIIPALQTDNALVGKVIELIKEWGKHPVVAKDTPGFIVNRIARPYYSEALRLYEEQLATPVDIDAAMKEVGGFRMGPFELMDFIGHDINEAVTRSVWTATHFESRYKPSYLQINLVRAGWLGKKSGKGFYDYTIPQALESSKTQAEKESIFYRIIVMLINEAAEALYYGVAQKEDIEIAMTLGVNYPKGLLHWADEIGIAKCVRQMDDLFDTYREHRYRCSPLLRRMATNHENFFS